MTRTLDDDALMVAAARGEEAAFRLLVQRWEGQVKAFLVHMLGSMEEAEDLAQDTFVQVFDKADSYRAEGRFRSWLFRIAGNRARSQLRRRRIIGWVTFNPDVHERAGAVATPAEEMEKAEGASRLQGALAGLPPRQRQALVLHRFQGLKYKEVAEAMNTTVPGVESLIQRAMAGLKKDLAGRTEGQ